MEIRQITFNAHSKPVTLAIGNVSAEKAIEPTAKYFVTPSVDMFFKVHIDSGETAVDEVDFYVPAKTTVILMPTGCNFFVAVGKSAGFVQLVRF